MENYIIIAVIILVVAAAVFYTVKHFKGEGGCCGGGGFRLRRKRLKQVSSRSIFTVEGMSCAKCKRRVEEAVGDVSGAAGRADHRSGRVSVFFSGEEKNLEVKERIERAGYTVKEIKTLDQGVTR